MTKYEIAMNTHRRTNKEKLGQRLSWTTCEDGKIRSSDFLCCINTADVSTVDAPRNHGLREWHMQC